MNSQNLAFSGGFVDPVFDAQSTFKTVMDCLARPGTIASLTHPAAPPSPLGVGAGAIALTVCDHDTMVFLSPAMMEAGVQGWFAFQTGALVTENREEAAFAFFEAGAPIPALTTFAAGTQDYPDRSSTLVIELPSLSGGNELTLAGPGIKDSICVAPKGLPPHFEAMWGANGLLYPRGVDVLLVSGTEMMGLPRTTRISRKEG